MHISKHLETVAVVCIYIYIYRFNLVPNGRAGEMYDGARDVVEVSLFRGALLIAQECWHKIDFMCIVCLK